MLNRLAGFTLALGVAAACKSPVPPPPLPSLPTIPAASRISYREQVQPVLERRCVVCHGCYDAPCQLLLSSPQGLARGASKDVVYDASRLMEAAPTRLFIDADGAAAWRKLGFFPVAGAGSGALLLSMLQLGRAYPFAPGEKLPRTVGLDINRPLSCARPDEFGAYARQHPQGGMPYGMAPLRDAA